MGLACCAKKICFSVCFVIISARKVIAVLRSVCTSVCLSLGPGHGRNGQHHLDTVSDADLYAVNFAAELFCLRDQSYTLSNDVVLNKDELNDLSVVLCE